ncbi:unnamed protein product [Sphagnum jensenii]|uniref:Uncharacterized protein n=1 Tax=Sphagnum jensenii TaxID=128206 RepID=A0ABP0XAD4_9BRYO
MLCRTCSLSQEEVCGRRQCALPLHDENEFKEEDVWDTDHDSCSRAGWSLEEPERSTHQLESSLQYAGSYGGVAAGGGGGGGSAPVNVPDWTKILGSEKKSQVPAWADEWGAAGLDDDDAAAAGGGEEKLPPHELLAREYANSQATTFSVFEGAGRTLKGRDLSRVRNAVLRQTGFIDF